MKFSNGKVSYERVAEDIREYNQEMYLAERLAIDYNGWILFAHLNMIEEGCNLAQTLK